MEFTEEAFVLLLRESFDGPAQKTLPQTITGSTELESLEGWDSLTRLALTVALEEEYGVMLEQENFAECRTVQELMDKAMELAQ